MSSPRAVRDYLRLRFAGLGHEVFLGLFLDSQNRLIACEEMFRGTLSQTSVFPREVVKHALRHNAAAVIFLHNHPSGNAEPSTADLALTQALRQALALVDVKVLDHLVVGSGSATSFAERGLLYPEVSLRDKGPLRTAALSIPYQSRTGTPSRTGLVFSVLS